jgi:hypothetical protein
MMRGIPKGAKRKTDNHLAEGEATGHFHAATAVDAELYEHAGGILLAAPSGTPVTHQEHATVLVPGDRIHDDQIPGLWDKSTVQEFDHFAEEARAVLD